MKVNNSVYSLIFLLTCILILSCNENSELKKYRDLRKKVLMHYKNDRNPLKEKAALFLLDHLNDRYAIEGERYTAYVDTIKKYYQNSKNLHKKLLSVKNNHYNECITKDIQILTPGYLIDNIDRAFEAIEKAGWKDEVSFNDFCEYILPYRIGNEPLEDWRKGILQDSIYKVLGDTIFSYRDIKTAANRFIKSYSVIKKGFIIQWGTNAEDIPDLQYSILNLLSTGACANFVQLSVFACKGGGDSCCQ